MKKLLLLLALCVPSIAVSADEARPHVTLWVHTFGCPRPKSDVVLVFSDGKSARIHIDLLSDEEKAALKALIGDVQGYNIVYDCGSGA